MRADIDTRENDISKPRRLRLARRLIAVQEEQCRRLSRELHDDLGQMLASVALELHGIRAGSAEQGERLTRTSMLVDQLSPRVHAASWNLRPADLDNLGLRASVEDLAAMLCAQLDIPCDMDLEALSCPLAPEVALTLYRVAQEALTNIGKHADARSAEVSLSRLNGRLVVEVKDDGRGGAVTVPGNGLQGLADRVGAVDGCLTIDSIEGHGTTIRAEIPCASS